MAISATTALASGVYSPATTTVARTSNASLASRATSLSMTAGVVATLGGSSSAAQVYSPAGLLNTLAQAGTVSAGTVSAGTGSPGSSGATGSGSATDPAGSGDWATILKANPSAAAFVIGASYTSGIIDTLA